VFGRDVHSSSFRQVEFDTAGLVVYSLRSPDDGFAIKLHQVDVESRAERRELRTRLVELWHEEIKDSRQKMKDSYNKLQQDLRQDIYARVRSSLFDHLTM
jgi:hypothetical protein